MSPGIKSKNRAVFNEAIGERLEKVRREVNYSVSQMASVMGISGYTYRSNVKGHNTPSLQGLCRLAGNLKVSLDWLLKGRGVMYYEQASKFRGLDAYNEEKEEMEALMEKLPLVRHSIMGYYQRFKLENMELISRALEKN